MPQPVIPIGLGGVNCFLLPAGDVFVLIDTGLASKRRRVVSALENAGCREGHLNLVVLTHADIDHAGNAAFLRDAYRTRIAMHAADAGMVERGDASWGRKAKPDRLTMTGRFISVAGRLMELSRRSQSFESFTPDVLLEDGNDLRAYGLDATVLHLPGHSPGSIGVLSGDGKLFCGDLIYNWRRPSVPVVDDGAAHDASMAKLRRLDIGMVYPGHGKPFAWKTLAERV